jgi:hypothetical protein
MGWHDLILGVVIIWLIFAWIKACTGWYREMQLRQFWKEVAQRHHLESAPETIALWEKWFPLNQSYRPSRTCCNCTCNGTCKDRK